MNAAMEITVLKNLRFSLLADIDQLIEKTERELKYQSPEVSDEQFTKRARVKFIQVLSKEITNSVNLI